MILKHKLIVIIGPTASGKSTLALDTAKKFSDIAIVNADAFQVYKDLQIITASPTNNDLLTANHYLYNYLDIGAFYSVAKYIQDVNQVLSSLSDTSAASILVGGSHMYIHNLLYGLDDVPATNDNIAKQTTQLFDDIGIKDFYKLLVSLDPKILGVVGSNDTQRMLRAYNVKVQTGMSIIDFYTKHKNSPSTFLNKYDIKIISVQPNREILYNNCNARVEFMFKNGAIEEVSNILTKNQDILSSSVKAIGFEEIKSYLSSKLSYQESINIVQQRTRNYAKRQVTWCNNKFHDKILYDSEDSFHNIAKQLDNWLST